jgi:hypothetical protein
MASWIWAFIPLAAILAGVFNIWIKHRERRLELQAEMTAEKAAQFAAHTEQLEQRVRVLERIATDRGIDVADEIEKLRHQPPIN